MFKNIEIVFYFKILIYKGERNIKLEIIHQNNLVLSNSMLKKNYDQYIRYVLKLSIFIIFQHLSFLFLLYSF